MKKCFRGVFLIITVLFIFCTMSLAVFGEGNAVYTNITDKENKNTVKASYGLDVLASQSKIEFAGIFGSPLNFSSEKIACALNLSHVDAIEMVSLPSKDSGILYFGSSEVACGQRITGNSIGLVSYEKTNADMSDVATFRLRVNDAAYDIECEIYMLDKINASPTLSDVPNILLNCETYRGVAYTGYLSAYDPEGDDIVYEIVSYPENGCIFEFDKSNGKYVYSPNESFSGDDSFVYVVKDKYGNYSASTEVNIRVNSGYTGMVYNDLKDSENYSYALGMTEKNVMNGERIGDNYYFRPSGEVSRVDFVVSAMKMLGIENLPNVDKTVFYDDENIGDEVKGYISLAYSKKYISGISDGEKLYFKPDEKIKLSEAAVIISNMIGYSKYETTPTFSNSDDIPSWSKQAVMSLRALGVIEAPNNSVFENSNISREQMAKLLVRASWVSKNT